MRKISAQQTPPSKFRKCGKPLSPNPKMEGRQVQPWQPADDEFSFSKSAASCPKLTDSISRASAADEAGDGNSSDSTASGLWTAAAAAAGSSIELFISGAESRRRPPTNTVHNVIRHTCIQGGPKKLAHFFVRLITSTNTDQLQTLFTVRFRRKFATILSSKILPHLKCFATLHCRHGQGRHSA